MSTGAIALLLLLASGAAAMGLRRALRPSREQERAAVRSTLFFAWMTVAGGMIPKIAAGEPLDDSLPPADGVITVSLAFLTLLWIAPRLPRAIGWKAGAAIAGWAAVLALECIVLDSALVLGDALGTAMRLAPAWALYLAMVRKVYPLWRTLAHAVSFASTVVVLLPLIVAHAMGERLLHGGPSATRLVSAVAVILVAGVLGAAGSAAFVRAGGTPDPLDPPPVLVQDGIYAKMRHPLQIAEALLVIAPAVWVCNVWVSIYAMCFVASLLGPMRRLEEALLLERFGDEAEQYRRRVPAFLPRGFRRRSQ